MTCPHCNGNSDDASECVACDGTGELCNRCGEAADDFGDQLCQNCREDEDCD